MSDKEEVDVLDLSYPQICSLYAYNLLAPLETNCFIQEYYKVSGYQLPDTIKTNQQVIGKWQSLALPLVS